MPYRHYYRPPGSHWHYRWLEFKADWRSWLLAAIVLAIAMGLIVVLAGKP